MHESWKENMQKTQHNSEKQRPPHLDVPGLLLQKLIQSTNTLLVTTGLEEVGRLVSKPQREGSMPNAAAVAIAARRGTLALRRHRARRSSRRSRLHPLQKRNPDPEEPKSAAQNPNQARKLPQRRDTAPQAAAAPKANPTRSPQKDDEEATKTGEESGESGIDPIRASGAIHGRSEQEGLIGIEIRHFREGGGLARAEMGDLGE